MREAAPNQGHSHRISRFPFATLEGNRHPRGGPFFHGLEAKVGSRR